LFSPFLPFSANVIDGVFGGSGEIQPMPELREADDLDGGAGYPILTGDYSGVPAWQRHPVVVGTPVAKPTPVFTKLDPSVVEEELARAAAL
jgi:methionyl-tRNA synthetase